MRPEVEELGGVGGGAGFYHRSAGTWAVGVGAAEPFIAQGQVQVPASATGFLLPYLSRTITPLSARYDCPQATDGDTESQGIEIPQEDARG